MTSISMLRSGKPLSLCTSMNRGVCRFGSAIANAGLNRSVCPTASIAPEAEASATISLASARLAVMGFSTSTWIPRSRNGRATDR